MELPKIQMQARRRATNESSTCHWPRSPCINPINQSKLQFQQDLLNTDIATPWKRFLTLFGVVTTTYWVVGKRRLRWHVPLPVEHMLFAFVLSYILEETFTCITTMMLVGFKLVMRMQYLSSSSMTYSAALPELNHKYKKQMSNQMYFTPEHYLLHVLSLNIFVRSTKSEKLLPAVS